VSIREYYSEFLSSAHSMNLTSTETLKEHSVSSNSLANYSIS